MRITVITLFPDMINGFIKESIIKRAIEKKLVEIELINLRDFAIDDYGTVDDRPYGGGAGMVLRVEPIFKALDKIKNQNSKVVLTSPKGKVFNQKKAIEYSRINHLVILAGHYEGVDERVKNYINEEVSIGDFILTGGEIAAVAICDSVVRLIPGVLKKDEATQLESFFTVSIDYLINIVGEDEILKKLKKKGVKQVMLLEYPQYTRPEDFRGFKVPSVLVGGNHKEIDRWRVMKAYEETLNKRKELLMVY